MAERGSKTGILAIWYDCASGHEETFEHWYQSEHLIERVSVPGFRYGRRYEGIADGYRQYFTFYETDRPDVLTSQAYIDRLNDPTPLTQTVMNGLFLRPSRTVCQRIARVGCMDGAIAVTAVSQNPTDAALWSGHLAQAAKLPGNAGAEVWQEVQGASNVGAREQEIRGGDETIAACVVLSVLRDNDVHAAMTWLQTIGVKPQNIGRYRFLCELRRENLING